MKQQKPKQKIDYKGLTALLSGKVSDETEMERWDYCESCPFLNEKNRCDQCGCFMRVKVKFKKAFCPIGVWGKEE